MNPGTGRGENQEGSSHSHILGSKAKTGHWGSCWLQKKAKEGHGPKVDNLEPTEAHLHGFLYHQSWAGYGPQGHWASSSWRLSGAFLSRVHLEQDIRWDLQDLCSPVYPSTPTTCFTQPASVLEGSESSPPTHVSLCLSQSSVVYTLG